MWISCRRQKQRLTDNADAT